MADPLWQREGVDIDAQIMAFLAGEDVTLDRELFVFDIAATRAHAQCLGALDIFDASEFASVDAALAELADDFAAGRFVLDERFEDGHTAIEQYLTGRLGDTGRKVHTGRSRNDQVLVATRLYLLDAMQRLADVCAGIASSALTLAAQHRDIPMPGYTHLQRAVVSSLGMWHAGLAEAFIDNAVLARTTRSWLSANPLGTAAGYGVNLALDRDSATRALGFERLQINPIYAQTSRGKFELQALTALAQALLDLRRLAWEFSLFTSAEFGFVTLPARYTTGSSIMPQKRNPDLVELLRAEYARVAGALSELQSVLSLPVGYHRDLQGTKGPLLRVMPRGLTALALVPDLLSGAVWDVGRLRGAIEPSMFATDYAVDLARAGTPFREAYRLAASKAGTLEDTDAARSLRQRVSPGASGDLRLEQLAERLRAFEE